MGGNTSQPSETGVENGIDSFEEDILESFGDKLVFLRNAMIQLHGQFLHFKHVQKFRNGDVKNDPIEEELKMMRVMVMVIYRGIEEVKSDKEIPREILTTLNHRIEEMSEVISRLILEFDEFQNNTSVTTIENLMNHLNPFDVPTVESLREGGGEIEPVMPASLNQLTEENEKQVEKLRRRRIQNEEELEVSIDNSRILHGHQRIQALLSHRVVLFINTLNDAKTLEVMNNLNRNHVDYTTFDVSTDPEIRFIAKELSDCEMFPQVFVDCEFKNPIELEPLVGMLPKVFLIMIQRNKHI